MNYAIILAGGKGTRFWPFSRELEPKQFMHITGGSTLLESTLERIKSTIKPGNIFVVSNHSYFYEVKSEIKAFGIPDKNIILEPEAKNTAPAIGLCARLILQADPDAILVVLPSDHFIKHASAFQSCLHKAISCAKKDLLVTIGIKPSRPATGYGYIKVKRKAKDKAGFFEVERFLEKPDLLKAKEYIKDKSFYWNSGIFVWRADFFLEELRRYLPDLSRQLSTIKSQQDIPRVWRKVTSISVDYGILEHSRQIALIPADFAWTDLGSWDALKEVLPKDKCGNIIQADWLNIDSKGICVLSRAKRLISTVGLKDLIIADTPDALLICDKDRAQDVKRIVERLKSRNRKECFVHMTDKRPWGSYTVLQTGEGFKIKLIEILPKKRLSLQRHHKRAEHWIVVDGSCRVTCGRKVKLVHSNQSIYIPIGMKHRLENPYQVPVKIVEVQTGNYLEEDDIERFDDDYIR